MFWKSRRKTARDLHQQVKMEESQRLLLSAATQTANAAHAVTSLMKSRLDDSLRQFECTARVINDALFVCELDGTIRASNPAARHMFAEPSLIGTSILNLFDLGGKAPADAETLWDLLKHSTRWSTRQDSPLRGHQPITGAVFWIEPTCAMLDWSDGTSSIIVLVRNVQPIAALRDSARDAKARFQQAFDLTFEGMAIVQDDRIQAANAAAGNLFGYTTSQLLGSKIVDLFVGEEHSIVSADIETSNVTVHGLHANGTLRSILFSCAQIMWHARTARLITMRDVTGLSDRPATMTLRVDNGVDVTCCFDPNYRIVWVNSRYAAEYGMSALDLVGQDVRDHVSPQARSEFATQVSELSFTAHASRQQEPMRADGSVRDWVIQGAFDVTGNAIEYQRSGRDFRPAA